MNSEKDWYILFSKKFCDHKKFSYTAFNLTMHQEMLGWQDFTNLMLSTNFGRFKKGRETLVYTNTI